MKAVYPPHPYATIFPFHDGPQLTELSDSINKLGQLEDIVILDGMVLDGLRRQAAMLRLGIVPRYRQFGSRPGDGTDPLEFAFAMNFKRRQLSQAELQISAAKYADLKKGDNQHTGAGPGSGAGADFRKPAHKPLSQEKEVTPNGGTSDRSGQKQAAEKFGVPVRTIQRTKTVLEKGTEELQEAMRTEEVSVSDAAAIVNEPPEVQNAAIEAVKAGEAPTLQAAVASTKPDPGENVEKLVRDLEHVAQRIALIQTEHVKIRAQAIVAVNHALGLIGKL